MKEIAVQLRNVPTALQALDRLEIEIQKAPSFERLISLTDAAVTMHRRWRPIVEVANRAGRCWIKGEFRLGEERQKVGPAKGAAGTAKGRDASGRIKLVQPEKNAPTLKELMLSKRQATRARKLVELGRGKINRLTNQLEADGKPIIPNTVLTLARMIVKTKKKHRIAQAHFSEDGPFDVAVIDFPWPMQKIDRDERPNQDAFDYPVMDKNQITEFWNEKLYDKLSPDCHVFLWTTQKYLPTTFELLKAFDLRYVLTMIWHKSGGFQPIDLPQYNCEFVVYARKGNPMFIETTDFFCCFEAPRREHSRKPAAFYETIARVTGGSRIDVFARERHPGFAQFGDEVSKFNEAAE